MRKQELIHVHGLLVATRHHFADQEDIDIPADAFDRYDDYGVGPTAIGERKDTHKNAVEHLLAGFHMTLQTQQRAADAPSPLSESIEESTVQ